MPSIAVDNVSLTFRVRQQRRLSLKEFLVRQRFRKSVNPIQEVRALENVSLQFKEGDRVGVLGHNGSGKSTLLKLLAGIYPPTAGKLDVRGRISSLFDIGLGFEADANGWENITFRGYLQGETPHTLKDKVKEIAEFTELGHFLDMPVRYYSAGMMVRLAFSIITTIEPEILLIDEVLGVGDLAFQQKARHRMTKMMDKARLIVMVSHDLDAIAQFCDTCVWMDHGHVRMVGKVADVIAAYRGMVNHGSTALAETRRQRHADSVYLPPGDGSRAVESVVAGLRPGRYDVQTTWHPEAELARDARFSVHDGSTCLGSVRVDQRSFPFGLATPAGIFQSLGEYDVTTGPLRVVLTNDSRDDVVGRLVRVCPVVGRTSVIDDGHPGFRRVGTGWRSGWNAGGVGNHVTLADPGDGGHMAVWSPPDLPAGWYDVAVSWVPGEDRATNALFTVRDGETVLAAHRFNQRVAPSSLLTNGVFFEHLGRFEVQSGPLTVTLTNDADGVVVADAVCVRPAGSRRGVDAEPVVAEFLPEPAAEASVAAPEPVTVLHAA